jgi:uncharacterized OB-fold protein
MSDPVSAAVPGLPPRSSDGLPDFPPRLDNGLLRPYWASLERGELSLPACSICGAWQWYPYEFVKCHAEGAHVWKTVATTGTVFTFAAAHRGFLPNADPKAAPYVSALVEIDGVVGPRIPTLLVNLAGREPAIGLRVRLVPLRRTGYTAPAFEPAP